MVYVPERDGRILMIGEDPQVRGTLFEFFEVGEDEDSTVPIAMCKWCGWSVVGDLGVIPPHGCRGPKPKGREPLGFKVMNPIPDPGAGG